MKNIIVRRSKNRIKNYSIIAIYLALLLSVATSCSNKIVTRELTGKITFDEIEEYSDTVDFYIKHIELFNVERSDTTYCLGGLGIGLYVVITNKLDEMICLRSKDDMFMFNGIHLLESGMNDTIQFGNYKPIIIGPKSSLKACISIELADIEYLFEHVFDNTIPMLNLIERTKFYYAPHLKKATLGQDTIVISNFYRLRTDKRTQITSWNNLKWDGLYHPDLVYDPPYAKDFQTLSTWLFSL